MPRNNIKVRRLFIGDPVRTAYSRPAEERDAYLRWTEYGFHGENIITLS